MKTAVVTGASSGIGEAIALHLAAAGYRVIALARREDRLEALCERAEGEVHALACDLRDADAIRSTFATIDERWATDVLVNSAGVGGNAALLDGDPDDWRAMLDVNVFALSLCTQLAVAQMRKRDDRGQIVHISSMSGHRAVCYAGMYAASKFAVQALTEGLRLELRAAGSGIRVASVSPGVVATRFGLADDEPDKERPWAMLTADDVAASVMHVVQAPEHVNIGDVLLRPTRQPN